MHDDPVEDEKKKIVPAERAPVSRKIAYDDMSYRHGAGIIATAFRRPSAHEARQEARTHLGLSVNGVYRENDE
jgi:hypothetical protein